MKSTKNIALVTLVFSAILISGCGKNDPKNTFSEKEVTKQDTLEQTTHTTTGNQKTETMNHKMSDMKNDTNDYKNIEHSMIKIPSAQCDVCESNLTKALKKVKGIKNFKIDINEKVIHVNYDKSITSISQIEKAITSAGYDANNKTADPVGYSKLDNCCKKPEDRGKKN